jgi:YD repeat-containing protein
MTGASQSGYALTFGYDALGRLTSQTGPRGSYALERDLAGRLTRLTWPDSFYVTYDYLTTGDVSRVRQTPAGPALLRRRRSNELTHMSSASAAMCSCPARRDRSSGTKARTPPTVATCTPTRGIDHDYGDAVERPALRPHQLRRVWPRGRATGFFGYTGQETFGIGTSSAPATTRCGGNLTPGRPSTRGFGASRTSAIR